MNEKEKGNECFRAGDYEEAVIYYSRSLDAIDTTAVYNNRALAHLKRKAYVINEQCSFGTPTKRSVCVRVRNVLKRCRISLAYLHVLCDAPPWGCFVGRYPNETKPN